MYLPGDLAYSLFDFRHRLLHSPEAVGKRHAAGNSLLKRCSFHHPGDGRTLFRLLRILIFQSILLLRPVFHTLRRFFACFFTRLFLDRLYHSFLPNRLFLPDHFIQRHRHPRRRIPFDRPGLLICTRTGVVFLLLERGQRLILHLKLHSLINILSLAEPQDQIVAFLQTFCRHTRLMV